MKLQNLSGRNLFQNKDFQSIITALIGRNYDTNKGKKFS